MARAKRCRSSRRRRIVTLGDEALADAVRRELAEDAATAELNIFVAVRNGVAHLRGQVADLDDADNAESVAARVPGIREVVEELDVAEHLTSDQAELTRTLAEASS